MGLGLILRVGVKVKGVRVRAGLGVVDSSCPKAKMRWSLLFRGSGLGYGDSNQQRWTSHFGAVGQKSGPPFISRVLFSALFC